MSIKNCECGSKEFYVKESYAYKAELDEEGELDCGHSDGGVDEICCAKCGKHFSEGDFKFINF